MRFTLKMKNGAKVDVTRNYYKKFKEFDIACKPGNMEYTFTYDQNIDPENGTKLKFEIFATRKTEKGAEQKSATSAQTIILK